MKKQISLFLVIAMLALLIAGCGENNGPVETAGPDGMGTAKETLPMLPTEALETELPTEPVTEAAQTTEAAPETTAETIPETTEPQETTRPETAYASGTVYIDAYGKIEGENAYLTLIFVDGKLDYHEFANYLDGKGSYSNLGLDMELEYSPYYDWTVEQVLEDLDRLGFTYTITEK